MPRMARRGPARRGPARRTTRRTVNRRHRRRRRRRRRVIIGGAMVVGTGAMAYKLGKSQKQQIEQASGTPIEEMTDEEIQQYVEKYNIPVESVTDSDQAAIAAAGDEEQYEDEEPDYTQELEKLADLHAKGILTDDEFAAKKKEILGL